MNRSLHHAAFAVGLLAVGWVGTGYVPGNPLALALVHAKLDYLPCRTMSRCTTDHDFRHCELRDIGGRATDS